MHAIHELVTFADRMGITRYVTVTTTSIERLLRRTGIEVTRLGPPVKIGVERTIALDITVDAIRAAVCKPMPVAA
jgi:acyl homoserine lactone synthase